MWAMDVEAVMKICHNPENETVVHSIAPVWNGESRVLILGTMPSPKSREQGFFYMHPQNRFWTVLPKVFAEKLAHPNKSEDKKSAVDERLEFLLRHRIAMWDVLASCSIKGASDSSICHEIPNDFFPIFRGAKISNVFFTGKTAYNIWKKLCAELYEKEFNLTCRCLPSTSPANARFSVDMLVEEYSAIKKCLEMSKISKT